MSNLFDLGLGINVVQLLSQIASFLLLLVLLNGLIIQPVLRNLEARRKRIEDGLAAAREADERLAGVNQAHQAALDEALAEANQQRIVILAEAQLKVQRMLAEAAAEAQQIKAQARAEAQTERDQLVAGSRQYIVAMVMAATHKLIGQSLDTQDTERHAALINSFFAHMPDLAQVAAAHIPDLQHAPIMVISALPLADEERAQVEAVLAARLGANAPVAYAVDPHILGGLVVRIGDITIDGSVSGKLDAMRRDLGA